jgi:ABC-type glycerol-3-phosphate transport system substrate-binding protein
MKSQHKVKGFCLIMAVALASAASGQPAFTASINISGTTTISVGQSTTLTATWTTNKDVTRSEWSIGTTGQGQVSFAGATSGTSTFTFTPTAPGTYCICFEIWHHADPRGSGHGVTNRWAKECVTITVTEAAECPAAPAIANAYLDSIGFTGGRGWIISAVTEEMGPGNDFHGYSKCDAEYAPEVIDFVDYLLSL